MSDAPAQRATSLIESLLDRVRSSDPSLADDLRRAIKSVTADREFGLVFNHHLPETVELPGRAVRAHDRVRIKDGSDGRIWRVNKVRRIKGQRVAELVSTDTDAETDSQPVDNLVVIADFRDPIYPGLKSTDKVERGGDKPFHAVINAENAHALEALSFTHAGNIDCIYIDPPYNTRANDWKYNNDYVDPSDTYSHSKWLAFMERRLKLAKKLLKPNNSALIVTIDENEVHRLGLLLEQTFPQARIQMATAVINPKGVTQDHLSRVDEYIFFVFSPRTRIALGADDLLTHRDIVKSNDGVDRPRWKGLLRSGDDAARSDRERMFYPVWIDPSSNSASHAGEWLPLDEEPDFDLTDSDGRRAAWPVRKDGSLGRWGVGADTLNKLIEDGFVRVGKYDKKRQTWGITYLSEQLRDELESGVLEIIGRDQKTGVVDVGYVDVASRRTKTVWHRSQHDAGAYGTDLIGTLVGTTRTFPFPKSLYAVEDTIRVIVGNKPEAIILDFFAGSGTTAHAVMRLNHQDGGRRRSISITNNEVSADEQKNLRRQGLHPGDKEWEKWGICEYITKPRIKAAVTGKTPAGEPVAGSYKFTDEFPMSEGFEENVEFFTLTYEDAEAVRLDLAFTAIAPMLWLRAGGQGSRIDTPTDTFAVADHYGVLFDPDHWRAFVRELEKVDDLRCVYVVTDDDALFQRVTSKLLDEVNGRRLDVVRLYENYLNNFEINTTRV